jgi:adenosylcobyric acid synthase
MLQGTSSSVGKSLLATAFCRIFARKGLRVAPFKAQNMALNSRVTPAGEEIGCAQVVQAIAARRLPEVEMNPILLKPEGNCRSQVVLMGRPWKTLSAGEYYSCRDELWRHVASSFGKLSAENDLVVVEGAGSPAEINLKAGEIVNMRVALAFGCPVLLVGDIDRGGVFASFAGTLALLDDAERRAVKGFIVNKFRGDRSLLEPGLEMLSDLADGRPVLGVIPWLDNHGLPQEDSVFLDETGSERRPGTTDIAVIRFPRISNYDDFDPLAAEEGVSLRFVERPDDFGRPAAAILPGTKTTLKDLVWLRDRGLDGLLSALLLSGGSIAGICGGYQMLGRRLLDRASIEGGPEEASGLGLLPGDTVFDPTKATVRVKGTLLPEADFANGESLRVEGYEIHMGRTTLPEGSHPLIRFDDGRIDGAVSCGGRVWGTYLHGIFDNDGFRTAWLRSIGWRGEERNVSRADLCEAAFERLADAVEAATDMRLLEAIVGL